MDQQGNLYVLDTSRESILKYSPSNHRLLATIGDGEGTDPGQLSNAAGLAVSPDGSVYVADTGNNRIEKFAPGTS